MHARGAFVVGAKTLQTALLLNALAFELYGVCIDSRVVDQTSHAKCRKCNQQYVCGRMSTSMRMPKISLLRNGLSNRLILLLDACFLIKKVIKPLPHF